ncbi:carbohydrate kinase family protein [Microbacterium gilvum]|uniref:Carbohydrate kinase n=1 Tax=Microbacterium gilvum TaxID=1336204 RepID=A0ABP8ZZT7_9MICO
MTSTPDILVVGEALVDVVRRADGSVDEKPGGSPANVAITLGRLGRAPRLLTHLGDDERGRGVRAWLEASGVAVEGAVASRTSTAAAALDATGAASYEFAIDWSVDTTDAGEPDALHVGSIATVLAPGADAVSALVDRLRARALVTFDPNIRPSLVDDADDVRRRVASLIARADVVKASDEDAAWLHPGEPIDVVARRWTAAGAVLVVITAGSDGALAARGDRVTRVPSPRVDVVDTVGAGDTFMGALVDGLIAAGAAGTSAREAIAALSEPELTAILRRSADAAAVTVSRPGADPPTRAELDG